MGRLVLEPRFMPESTADGARAILVAAIQLTVLLAPGFIFWWLVKEIWFAGIVWIAVPWFYGLHCISETSVDEKGIYFKRTRGNPTHIPWEQVDAMAPVSPTEVVLYGWLWPFFPAREMTPCLTSVGHYRIEFGTERVYFPPKDPKELFRFWPKGGGA